MAQTFFPQDVVDEYLSNKGVRCPHCKSYNIDSEPAEVDDECLSLRSLVHCEDCDGDFEDVYELVDVLPVVDAAG